MEKFKLKHHKQIEYERQREWINGIYKCLFVCVQQWNGTKKTHVTDSEVFDIWYVALNCYDIGNRTNTYKHEKLLFKLPSRALQI